MLGAGKKSSPYVVGERSRLDCFEDAIHSLSFPRGLSIIRNVETSGNVQSTDGPLSYLINKFKAIVKLNRRPVPLSGKLFGLVA